MKTCVSTSTIICLLSILLFLATSATEAFAPSTKIFSATSKKNVLANNKSILHPRTPVALEAYKKKEPAKKPEEKEQTPPLKLLIAYMTPWRNPNSIFVYLFLLVYILGSYSEAKSAAGGM
mmetsp:Transcript_17802/g.43961  ORF Transcript_17802/g.43961 Transcript_17802/m.43961 type:complete len:121 (+) Transcript_17802:1460-1822(+)